MRGLVTGVLVAALVAGAAAAASGPGPQPKRPAWGCKADHRPDRKAVAPEASNFAPREGRLYRLDRPAYCDAPQPEPRRASPRAPQRT